MGELIDQIDTIYQPIYLLLLKKQENKKYVCNRIERYNTYFIGFNMRNSLSNIRKYQATSRKNVDPQPSQAKKSFELENSRIPELVCENQSLRDRIAQLEKQKEELLIKSVVSDAQPKKNQFFFHKLKNQDNTQSQKCLPFHDIQKRQRDQPPTIKQVDKSSSTITEDYSKNFHILIEKLNKQKQENSKLNIKIITLMAIITDNEKQMKQMSQIISKLTDKLGQSNLLSLNPYLSMQKINEKVDIGTECSLEENLPRQTTSNITYIQRMNQSLKYQDYFQVKDENYKLRDLISQLSYKNQLLQQKVTYSSKAIDHLWKIKQIEYQNLHLCLRQLKPS